MPDSSASTPTSPSRSGPTKRRAQAVAPGETEDKLARAAHSAQQLAQLTDVPRDENNLDLFPDDAARAAAQAASIDPRQGTLSGFEWPESVLAAALQPTQPTQPVQAGAAAPVARPAAIRAEKPATRGPTMTHEEARPVPASIEKPAAALKAPDALISAAATGSATAATAAAAVEGTGAIDTGAAGEVARPRRAGTVDAPEAALLLSRPSEVPPPRAETGAPRERPELDRARATAFADTVDALYGVIADQRHAAASHSRRLKWLLGATFAVLVLTLAIGVIQTMRLARFARETAQQQQHIETLMQDQQNALAKLLAAAASGNAASPVAPNPPAAPAAVARRPATRAAAAPPRRPAPSRSHSSRGTRHPASH